MRLTVASVASPDGTIIHSVRGAASFRRQRIERGHGLGTMSFDTRACFRLEIKPNDAMAAGHQPLRHVGAHTPEPDHAEFHPDFLCQLGQNSVHFFSGESSHRLCADVSGRTDCQSECGHGRIVGRLEYSYQHRNFRGSRKTPSR